MLKFSLPTLPKKPTSFETDEDFNAGLRYFFEVMRRHHTGVFEVSEQDQSEILTFFQLVLSLKISKQQIEMIPEIKSFLAEMKEFKETIQMESKEMKEFREIVQKESKEFKETIQKESKEMKEFKEIVQKEMKEFKETMNRELKGLNEGMNEIKFEGRRNRCRLLNNRLKPYEDLVPLPDNNGKIPKYFPKRIPDIESMDSKHLETLLKSYGLSPRKNVEENRVLLFDFVLYG
jgi:gas vesicle protein